MEGMDGGRVFSIYLEPIMKKLFPKARVSRVEN